MNSNQLFAYVGSRTTAERNARGKGISVFRVDEFNQSLELVQIAEALPNPSFLAIDSANAVLYTVHGDMEQVSSYKINRIDGTISHLCSQFCGGKNPVHVAIDPTGTNLLISNHISHNVSVLPITADGQISAPSQIIELVGTPGPHRKEQPFSKPHFNLFDPTGKYLAVPDKGLDRIFMFEFSKGRLTPAPFPWVDTRETAGPRHIVFSSTKTQAYVVNELDSTVTTYEFDLNSGNLRPVQVLSSLPSSFCGNSRASEIALSRDNKFLYVSNRGYDSVAVFAVDSHSGLLIFIDAFLTYGTTPRFFAISPNEQILFALNEDSDTIVALPVAVDGGLGTPIQTIHSFSPVCMVFGRW